MEIREYRTEDLEAIAQLFYDTVHTVNRKDYTKEQTDAWACGQIDPVQWNASFLEHDTAVAVEGEKIIGFADMSADGYLDRLYVHKDYQGRGIAAALCDKLEGRSAAAVFTTHASITARPFFEKRSYQVVKEQMVERRGVFLKNFVMRKIR